jgi:hypothetical protein
MGESNNFSDHNSKYYYKLRPRPDGKLSLVRVRKETGEEFELYIERPFLVTLCMGLLQYANPSELWNAPEEMHEEVQNIIKKPLYCV